VVAGTGDGKPGGAPGAVAAEQVGDVGEAGRGQNAGRHLRAVAAGTVDDHRQIAVEGVDRVGEHG
jgi:hypothetical protein